MKQTGSAVVPQRGAARRLIAALAVMSIVATACGGDDDDDAAGSETADDEAGDSSPLVGVTEVTTQDESTGEISVWSPDDAAGLPVVYVLHGQSNDRGDMAGFATALAREGLVVFVPDIRTAEPSTAATDVECGYHLALETAADFGGDSDRPVTLVGWSFGAVTAFFSGLDESASGLRGLAEGCPLDGPRPEIIVSIAGCHTTWDGDSEPLDPAAAGWTNTDAEIVLVAGELDTACQPRESAEAAEAFESAGYAVDYTEIPGADHGAMLFYPPENYGTVDNPTGDAGEQTVQLIREAIARSEN